MRAAQFYAAHDIRVEDVPAPQPTEGQVQVDVEWCGICGSDLHEYLIGPVFLPTKEHPHPITGVHIPVTLGHELCGRVRDPPAGSKFRNGEAVMVDPRVVCHRCVACKDGMSHCCQNLGYVGGSTGFGGYGEKVVVHDNMLLRLPPQIPLEYAAVLEPLAVVWHAIKETGVSDWKDKNVLVLGAGPIGLALCLCLKALGANKVTVSEPAAARREQVKEFAQTVLSPLSDDVIKSCLDSSEGRGAEVLFDCAGVPQALDLGFKALRYAGLYMMVAVWEKPLTLPCWTFLAKHITVKGTLIMADGDFDEVMQMMAEGKLVGYEKLVTGRIDLDDIVKHGFEELVNHKDKHIKILVKPRKDA